MNACRCNPYFFVVCDEHKDWPRCPRCFGTGYIPSETCDECVDCQDKCPNCHGLGRVKERER